MKFLLAAAILFLAGCGSAQVEQPVTSKEGCHTPLGFIPEGHTAPGYLHQVANRGQHCEQGVLTCTNGVWAGVYIYPSCVMTP